MSTADPPCRTHVADAFEPLRRQHRLLRRALRALREQADHIENVDQPASADLSWVLRFLGGCFAQVHRNGHTNRLLAAMALYGDDRQAELAGTILRERDENRALFDSVSLLGSPGHGFAERERRAIADALRTCAGRVDRMLRKEETILVPAARACIPADELLDLARGFRERAPDPEGGDHEGGEPGCF